MKTFKYSMFLAVPAVRNFSEFLTEKAVNDCVRVKPKTKLPFACEVYLKKSAPQTPEWAKRLDTFFEVAKNVETSSAAAIILFRCKERVMACTYGHGHVLLDTDRKENDFGLIVAANSMSDENVKLVEKANLGSVIRDFTQASGITKLQEFNVDKALGLVRKLSGKNKEGGKTVSGASSFSFSHHKDVDQLHEIGESLLDLYNSDAYKKSAFGIIDKIKPIQNAQLVDKLDADLVTNLSSNQISFELGMPEIDTDPVGYIALSGISNKRATFPDVDIADYLSLAGAPENVETLHTHSVRTFDLNGNRMKHWSVYRGLVGSIDRCQERYALNEGKWYSIADALSKSANSAFSSSSLGLDKQFKPWAITGTSKKGVVALEPEGTFNLKVHHDNPTRFLHFDTKLFRIPNNPGNGVEICDLFDVQTKTLVHVKKSGRRSSVISHFLNQGMNSAKVLCMYPDVKDEFLNAVKGMVDSSTFAQIRANFPNDWSVEFKFGDKPNQKGDFTIPFFSRVAFDEVKREIEALGFKEVKISFIRLSSLKPSSKA